MKKIIRFFRPVIIFAFKTYWFIFRPVTKGVHVIVTHGSEILLVQHTYGYRYQLPGGKMKRNESPECAVKRELFEELKIADASLKYVGSEYSNEYYKKDVTHTYIANVSGKETCINNYEIDDASWFSINSLSENVGRNTRAIIDQYKPLIS